MMMIIKRAATIRLLLVLISFLGPLVTEKKGTTVIAFQTPAAARRRSPPPQSTTTATSAADSSTSTTTTWTPQAWKGVLSDLPFETKEPRNLRITGTIPSDLVGILYKAGPAKFQRNNQQYAHWLEGDGAVIRLEFTPGKQQQQQVTYTSRFVQTQSFRQDEQEGCTTVRGTFGTPKTNGKPNAFDLKLKNPSNTNVVRIADQVLAMSEVGLPHQLDATTLETLGLETFDDRYKEGNSAATVGNPTLDNLLGFGDAIMAHVRENVPYDGDDEEDIPQQQENLIMAAVKQDALTDDTKVELWELNPQTGDVLGRSQQEIILKDTGFPPHDFICTTRHAIWLTCPAGGNLLPFILGAKGPAECLSFRKGATSTLHMAKRRRQPTGADNDDNSDTTTTQAHELPRPIHPIHFGCAWEEEDDNDSDGEVVTTIYLCGWDTPSMNQMMKKQEPLLGSWTSIQEGDFSNIQPQPIIKVSLRRHRHQQKGDYNNMRPVVTVETIAQDSIQHIDFVKCHPNFEGQQCRYLFGVISTPPTAKNPCGVAPPQSICIVDLLEESVLDSWYAGYDNILDDFVLVPKKKTSDGDDGSDELSAYVIAPVYHGATTSTSFVVLDANNLSNGPICEAHLDDHHVPWALHGSWWPTTD